jgi:hypothetical protein
MKMKKRMRLHKEGEKEGHSFSKKSYVLYVRKRWEHDNIIMPGTPVILKLWREGSKCEAGTKKNHFVLIDPEETFLET